jgi:quinol-cytochrome oxidoreductase complex cytochrome b subunit
MTTRIGNWFDERVGWRGIWQAIFLRKIPKVNWFFTLGSASLFVALTQGITGILLTLYYVPTPDHAYDSVQYITTQVAGGWFIRGLHHWGASAMVVLVFLHMLRVIFYGAYKILAVVRGGEELSAITLARFFGVHVWVLPTVLISLILVHLYLVIRLGISAIPGREE